MKKLYCTITFVMCLVTSAVLAQGPNNSGVYYQQANGKKGAALKTAFFNIIKNPDVVSYNGLIEAYHKTDTRPDGYIRDWYSNSTSYTWNDRNGNSREGAGWNREHSVPQSWFSKSSPMVSDIVHVLPTDCYVNNRRSSYPFGEVGSTTYVSNNGYSKLGSCKTAGYSGTVEHRRRSDALSVWRDSHPEPDARLFRHVLDVTLQFFKYFRVIAALTMQTEYVKTVAFYPAGDTVCGPEELLYAFRKLFENFVFPLHSQRTRPARMARLRRWPHSAQKSCSR